MKSAPAIALDVRPSPALALAAGIVGVLAMLAPWLCAVPLPAKLAVSLVALAASAQGLRAFLGSRVRRIAYRATGWSLVDAAGNEHAADLVRATRLGAWIVLAFAADGFGRARLVLGPDNADAETRRRLAVLFARAEFAQVR